MRACVSDGSPEVAEQWSDSERADVAAGTKVTATPIKQIRQWRMLMQTIKLNNGIECPVIGLGTFMLSPEDAQKSTREALKWATGLLIRQTPM